jgi:large subunit ribosomal protein L25
LELIKLNATTRQTKGKGAARKLRAEKAIPAIVYGAKVDPLKLAVDAISFDKVIRDYGTTGLFFDLKVDGGKKRMVMLKDLQMDPFGLKYLHVDFHEIDMDHKVYVTIPVETEGVCAGAQDGGMLQIIRRELDVYCKPKDTPESIIIDITDLDIGDAVHVEDIDLGEDVEIPHEVNFTVVTVVPPSSDADELEEEEDDEAEIGEVAEDAEGEEEEETEAE